MIIIRLLRIKAAQNSKYTHFKTENIQVAIEESVKARSQLTDWTGVN